MSQLLNLIKRMRDGKAITKKVVVIWALKRLEAMDWFREELRICRDSAPPESVTCKFFVTAAVRQSRVVAGAPAWRERERGPRPLSSAFHDRLDGFVAGIASKRNSAMIRDEAQGNPDYERELRAEDEDRITALPRQKYLQPHAVPPPPPPPANRQSAQEESLRRLEGRDHDHDRDQYNVNDDDTTTVRGDSETLPSAAPKAEGYEEGRGGGESEGGPGGDGGGFPEDKPKREFHFPPLHTRPDLQPHFNYAPPSPRKLPPQHEGGGGGEAASSGGPRPPEFAHLRTTNLPGQPPQTLGGGGGGARPTSTFGPPSGFDFGFPETPTEFQKSLMRFAFPVPHQIGGGSAADGGWSVEYGRPDLGYMLREWATGGADGRGILGRRTAVFVCGPPGMRVGVAGAVARLQAEIWGDELLEEIFLHTENYAL